MCATNYDFTDQEQSKKARMLVKGRNTQRHINKICPNTASVSHRVEQLQIVIIPVHPSMWQCMLHYNLFFNNVYKIYSLIESKCIYSSN